MDYSPYITWYEKEAGNARQFEPLTSAVEADVCVIGSGFIGLSAALKVAREGRSVVVLEPGRLTFGNGGRTGGFVESGVKASVDDLADLLGRTAAQRMWQYSIDARSQVLALINERGMTCGMKQGVVTYTTRAADAPAMHKAASYVSNYFQNEFTQNLLGAELADTGFPSAKAGVRWSANAVVNPIAFLHGLVEACLDAGVKIYEKTPVVSYEQQKQILVKTKKATVRAGKMLVCGNAYMDVLQSPEKTQTVSARYFQIVTNPVDEAVLRDAFPKGDAFLGTTTLRRYIHTTADNRVVMGGPVPLLSPKNREKFAEKQLEKLTQKLPALAGKVTVSYLWQGMSGIPMNYLPVFHKEDDNIFAAHGFNGHGVALAYMAGQELATIALKDTSDAFELFARVRQKPLPRVVHHFIAKVALMVYRVRDFMLYHHD